MTTTSTAALARVLVWGDSAFPAGAFTASWGLEGLVAEGAVADEEHVTQVVLAHVGHRWATFDRVLLRRAGRVVGDLDALVELDELAGAATWIPAARAASSAAGGALLHTHAALGHPGAIQYRAAVTDGRAHGHLPIAQAIVWSRSGLTDVEIELVAGIDAARQVTSAAVRLGVIGHLGAQRVLERASALVLDELARPAPDEPSTSTAAADLAMLAHPQRPVRLFAC